MRTSVNKQHRWFLPEKRPLDAQTVATANTVPSASTGFSPQMQYDLYRRERKVLFLIVLCFCIKHDESR